MTARQLLIWPEGSDLVPVRRAFESLGTPFKVSPHWFDINIHTGRVLVLADGFHWMHDHIYPKIERVLPDAIAWCVGARELERGPRLKIDLLSSALGGEVREVSGDTD